MTRSRIIYLLIFFSLVIFGVFYALKFKEKTYQSLSYCPKTRQLDHGNYHSEYFEDYVLSIIFKNQTKGHYVDVGSGDPLLNNSTKFFYDQGWSGINIEPRKEFYDHYQTQRNLDKNYNLAISNISGEDNIILTNKQSSIWDRVMVKTKSYLRKIKTYLSSSETLNKILAENNYSNFEFLRINAKFFEKNIFLSLDFNHHRPQVIVVESLDTKELTSNHANWEDIILNNDYHFIMFDGLSRYYIDSKVHNLKDAFAEAYKCLSAIEKQKNIFLAKPFLAN